MRHFGIISPPVPGHIHPMCALGRELIARGHKVTYFQVQDLERKILSEEVDFHRIGGADYPAGSLPASLARLAQFGGLSALRFTIDAVARTTEMLCRDAPDAIRAAGVDALLVDQMEPGGGAIAEHLALPFVTICNALPLNRDAGVPPAFSPWRYRDSKIAVWRNRFGYALSDWLTRAVTRVVARYREEWGLKRLESPDESFSQLAQISQMPEHLDFPRHHKQDNFHYVGPLRRSNGIAVPFPWERLDGRPVVYASLGTLQNRRASLFTLFAEACRQLDLQLVLAHGGGLDALTARSLPGDPIAVSYAPQQEVLERSALTLCHGGLNTVLDSILAGVPLVTVPITFEQPAIARRVEASGCGATVDIQRLRPSILVRAIRTVLGSSVCAKAVLQLQSESLAGGGVRAAAMVVERQTA